MNSIASGAKRNAAPKTHQPPPDSASAIESEASQPVESKIKPEDNPESIHYKSPEQKAKETAAVEPVSPTLITLYVRPAKGEKFNIGWDEAADLMGLRYPRCYRIGSQHLCHNDTGESIAEFMSKRTFMGDFLLLTISIDPEQCPIQLSTGTYLKDRVERALSKMGGRLFDGAGHRLSWAQFEAVCTHIDDVMDRRWHAAEKAKRVRIAPYKFRVPGPVSFQHYVIDGRGGSHKHWTYFDTGNEKLDYFDARAKGHRMARELVDYLDTHKLSTANVIDAIVAAYHEWGKTGASSTVAKAFLDCMERALQLGAGNYNLKWFDREINRLESAAREIRERDAS